MASWLNNAIFYEIYPQSFNDSNGDGIGDFQGIIDKLQYVHDLKCNAIWINPCFDFRCSTMPATTYATTTQPRNATAATRTCSGLRARARTRHARTARPRTWAFRGRQSMVS